MYAALSESTNILMGFTGLIPFGNVVYFGIGAYMTAILMGYGMSFYMSTLIGGIACCLFTLAYAHPILKMRGQNEDETCGPAGCGRR